MNDQAEKANNIDGGMQPLVICHDDKIMTTSLNVAEVFGKEHKNVLRDIREFGKEIEGCQLKNERAKAFFDGNFIAGEYLDEQGKPRLMFKITRDGFALLAMGFTGVKALEWKLRYIAAFNDLEAMALVKASQFSPSERARAVKRDSQLRLAYSKQIDALGKSLENCWDKGRRSVLYQDIAYLCGITGMQAPLLPDFGVNTKQQAMDL